MGMGMGIFKKWVWVRVWVLGMKKPGIPKMGMGMGIPEPGIVSTHV